MPGSSRMLSILPCDISPNSCTLHATGRNIIPERHWRTRLSSLLVHIGRPLINREPSKPVPCPPILALPFELLFEIRRHLDEHERIALALTCKAIYGAFGKASFSSIQKTPNGVKDVLILLQRDMSTYRLCASCKTLHHPQASTMVLPRNKLRRTPWHPTVLVYLYPPSPARNPCALYWLSTEHRDRILSHQICLSTLRCKGTVDMMKALPSASYPGNAALGWTVTPVVTRKTVIFYAEYQVQLFLNASSNLYKSQDDARQLLKELDVRCCLHCSTDMFLEEMMCFMFHLRENSLDAECVRRSPDHEGGCGRQKHKHDCACVSDFSVEFRNREDVRPQASSGIRESVPTLTVRLWQWLGPSGDDAVLKYKGVLQNLYEDAYFEDGW